MAELKVGPSRPEPAADEALREWFETQELKSVDSLEAGARQIIQLVGLFYGVLFGALSLGSASLEAALHHPWVIVAGVTAIIALLVAVLAALVVTLPLFAYRYNPHKPAEQRAVFQKLLRRKVGGLRLALIAFGLGLIAFAWLIGLMLYNR